MQPTEADYIYFQSFITVPESFTGPFAMAFTEVDDGARVEINPFADAAFSDAAEFDNYVTANDRTTGDLSGDLDLGDINRIVVTLVDACRTEAILTGATFLTGDAVDCEPGGDCTATVQGSDNRFTVVASGGDTSATLFAEPNGGPAPECGLPVDSDLVLSPDWVRFGFLPDEAGRTWTKDVSITSLDEMDAAAAEETQVCFAAPYQFDTRPGYPALAGGPEGSRTSTGSCRTASTAASRASRRTALSVPSVPTDRTKASGPTDRSARSGRPGRATRRPRPRRRQEPTDRA